MSETTTADRIAERLHAAGVRRAWGMPGGEVLTLVDALERAGIECVLARHETPAGFMAEGDWSATGAPGVLIGTLGPGAMNAVNVVANAHQDRVPLIVLTGCVDEDEAATYTHQVMDHRAVFGPVTKASFRISAGTASVTVDKALRLALSGRRGPVHLDLPISAAGAASPEAPALPPVPTAGAPAPETVARLRAVLEAAERPVLLAGLDATDAPDAIARLADGHGVPVVTTYRAKGVLPEDHRLSLGGAGLSPLADEVLLPLMREADLVILAGYDPIEMRPGWRQVWDPARQEVIDLVVHVSDHGMHGAGIECVGDVGAALGALGEATPRTRVSWHGRIEAARAELADRFPVDEAWGPAAIVAECREAMPANAVATADSGAHRILLSQIWRCPAPRTLLQSSGLCTMGCALPLAIGHRVAAPDVPVIAFMGDAGLLMCAGELATAVERAPGLIGVVFVDASLALIEKKQRSRQLPNAFVDFEAPDVAAIGRAFGGHGIDVRSREELREALASAPADRFTLIAAHIERGAYDGRI